MESALAVVMAQSCARRPREQIDHMGRARMAWRVVAVWILWVLHTSSEEQVQQMWYEEIICVSCVTIVLHTRGTAKSRHHQRQTCRGEFFTGRRHGRTYRNAFPEEGGGAPASGCALSNQIARGSAIEHPARRCIHCIPTGHRNADERTQEVDYQVSTSGCSARLVQSGISACSEAAGRMQRSMQGGSRSHVFGRLRVREDHEGTSSSRSQVTNIVAAQQTTPDSMQAHNGTNAWNKLGLNPSETSMLSFLASAIDPPSATSTRSCLLDGNCGEWWPNSSPYIIDAEISSKCYTIRTWQYR